MVYVLYICMHIMHTHCIQWIHTVHTHIYRLTERGLYLDLEDQLIPTDAEL